MFWETITSLASSAVYMTLGVLIFIFWSPQLGYRVIASLSLAGMWTLALKNLLKMPRPPEVLWKVKARGYGFPSGHASTVTAFFGSLAVNSRSKALALIALILISLVSYSRIALRVHYPLDVIGGICLGIIAVLISTLDMKKLKLVSVANALLLIPLGLYLGINRYEHYALAGLILGLSLMPKDVERIRTMFVKCKIISFIIVGLISVVALFLSKKFFLLSAPSFFVAGLSIAYVPYSLSRKC